jgi:hypothetical protein
MSQAPLVIEFDTGSDWGSVTASPPPQNFPQGWALDDSVPFASCAPDARVRGARLPGIVVDKFSTNEGAFPDAKDGYIDIERTGTGIRVTAHRTGGDIFGAKNWVNGRVVAWVTNGRTESSKCFACGGTGRSAPNDSPCLVCRGRGQL